MGLIHTTTSAVWTMMNRGVPNVRANDSASRPNLSPPKGEERWLWGARNLR